MHTDYAGQEDGVNEQGCPYIYGQNVSNAVQNLTEVLAQLGITEEDLITDNDE